ncbi:DUF260 domain-containing protein [Cephalotus follicularis]|uniref:DUF260 domain-containing protein n=1 Tax=Cephalotus follicularis TaxID=3775 RepID=A0A1Q3DGJ8_CEPFO|nr:DUF260 domain-containing protein [Cephalotus follicularis]
MPIQFPCCACTYQRQRCEPGCLLAPYFPKGREKQFTNARSLFGMNKIVEFLIEIEDNHRDDFMKSIIYEADARAKDPVGGTYAIIYDLDTQLKFAMAELVAVRRRLDRCRRAQASDQQGQETQDQVQETLPSGDILNASSLNPHHDPILYYLYSQSLLEQEKFNQSDQPAQMQMQDPSESNLGGDNILNAVAVNPKHDHYENPEAQQEQESINKSHHQLQEHQQQAQTEMPEAYLGPHISNADPLDHNNPMPLQAPQEKECTNQSCQECQQEANQQTQVQKQVADYPNLGHGNIVNVDTFKSSSVSPSTTTEHQPEDEDDDEVEA